MGTAAGTGDPTRDRSAPDANATANDETLGIFVLASVRLTVR